MIASILASHEVWVASRIFIVSVLGLIPIFALGCYVHRKDQTK